MKRTLLFVLPLLTCFVYFACRKDQSQAINIKPQDPFVTSAVEYLKSSLNNAELAQLNFDDITLISDGDKTFAAEIFTKDKSKNKFVFLSKDTKEYSGKWVEYLPINNISRSTTDGIIKTERFDGTFKSELTYLDNKPVKYIKTINGQTSIITVKSPQKNSLNSGNPTTAALRLPGDPIDILPPVTVTAYINGSHTTSILYSLYYYDAPPAYWYSYTSTQGGGGGNSTAYTYTNLVYSPRVDKHIASIADYLKCFTNVAGSTNTYNIRLCVDQPVPGERTAWGFSGNGTANSSSGANPINVGHTFLILTEVTPTGTITRNVGFYPTTNVNPRNSSSQGQLVNNDDHSFNISLNITMTNSQFFNVLNYVSRGNNTGVTYDLYYQNCTTFALNALSAGSIYLGATIGSWPGGRGYDPGDMGEDIRSKTLSSNMTRTTMTGSHPNLGGCDGLDGR